MVQCVDMDGGWFDSAQLDGGKASELSKLLEWVCRITRYVLGVEDL